jgi:hypothetical protein
VKLTEEVTSGVSAVPVDELMTVAEVEAVEVPLTSWPVPQGIASPSGWVL